MHNEGAGLRAWLENHSPEFAIAACTAIATMLIWIWRKYHKREGDIQMCLSGVGDNAEAIAEVRNHSDKRTDGLEDRMRVYETNQATANTRLAVLGTHTGWLIRKMGGDPEVVSKGVTEDGQV